MFIIAFCGGLLFHIPLSFWSYNLYVIHRPKQTCFCGIVYWLSFRRFKSILFNILAYSVVNLCLAPLAIAWLRCKLALNYKVTGSMKGFRKQWTHPLWVHIIMPLCIWMNVHSLTSFLGLATFCEHFGVQFGHATWGQSKYYTSKLAHEWNFHGLDGTNWFVYIYLHFQC